MRWVAAEPEPAAPEPMRVPAIDAHPVAQRSPKTRAEDAPKAAGAPVAEVRVHTQAPHTAAAELLTTRQHPPQRTTAAQPESDAGLQLSIGAIHLRVDAPQAPALQAAPAPRPAPPPTLASSGLSRRALRRL